MPEGPIHRALVQALTDHLRTEFTRECVVLSDCKNRLAADGLPPQLGEVRPDFYAREYDTAHVIIGEAKIEGDLDNDHTLKQVRTYLEHLAQQDSGELVLAVPLLASGTAHRICRTARKELGLDHIPFRVTGWLIGGHSACETWNG
jgi:hypothetical protein